MQELDTFFFQAEDGIRDLYVTGVQTCALPILPRLTISQPKRREPTMPFRLNQSGGGEANSRCVSRSTNSGLPKQTQPQRNAHMWRTIAATIRMPTSQCACAVGTQPSISSTSITSRYLSISARIRRNEQNRFARPAIFCSHRPRGRSPYLTAYSVMATVALAACFQHSERSAAFSIEIEKDAAFRI